MDWANKFKFSGLFSNQRKIQPIKKHLAQPKEILEKQIEGQSCWSSDIWFWSSLDTAIFTQLCGGELRGKTNHPFFIFLCESLRFEKLRVEMDTKPTEISSSKMFGGFNKRYKHFSPTLGCSMNFSIYFPPSPSPTHKFPVCSSRIGNNHFILQIYLFISLIPTIF